MKPFFGATTDNLIKANLLALGVPWDVSSSYRRGSAEAPDKIRQATSGNLYNPYTETYVDILDKWQMFDAGNVMLSEHVINARTDVFKTLKPLYNQKKDFKFLFLGGDHLITYFCIHSLVKLGLFQDGTIGILYFDAHPDLYEHYEGNRYSHACVLRRVIEETPIDPKNIFQVGIRAGTTEQREFSNNHGITTITSNEFLKRGVEETAVLIQEFSQKVDHIYLSIDLDILDPAFAPGLGNPEPAGVSTRKLVDLIQELTDLPIVAFDLVELCPAFDKSNISAFAAAKVIKETLGVLG
ncbi:MAG: agmatinase [Candidatus Heimdallarchaeota archaeon]|nr:MAG: agmatinase [Candidatus Heimdallarchaeota archaeon]